MTTTKATNPGNELTILKQDGRGRVRTSAARREQLLDEFERSGLSGAKFAELVGVKYQTFATWVQRRQRQLGAAAKVPVPTTESVKWLEAVLASAPPAVAGAIGPRETAQAVRANSTGPWPSGAKCSAGRRWRRL